MLLYKNTVHPALITTPRSVAQIFLECKAKYGANVPLVTTSGGFDPIHVGNLKCIQGAAMLKGEDGLLCVIVNGDGFLERKKGFVFMPLDERMDLIAGLKGVDVVVPWDDGSQFVTQAIEIMKPNIFAKGGDRSRAENVPEYQTCVNIGCNVVFGIGGVEKLQSSSELVQRYQKSQ